MKENDLLCPSAPVTPNSFLFGIFSESGELNYTEAPIPVEMEMFTNISSPEKHFRFTSKCENNGCAQWGDGKCGIAKNFQQLKEDVVEEMSTSCSIQKACRWVHQEGTYICNFCKYIVTDNSL